MGKYPEQFKLLVIEDFESETGGPRVPSRGGTESMKRPCASGCQRLLPYRRLHAKAHRSEVPDVTPPTLAIH